MSDSSSVKGLINRSTQIVCPKCGYVTRQKCAAMLQDVILICPNCETRFEPRQG
ncbi:YnfU family zinc-binding protein [Serratia nematodiphila]